MVTQMTVSLSKIYGMDIYTSDAKYIGKVNDVILNMETGEAVRILTKPLTRIDSNTKELIQKHSVLFRRVKSISDMILVQK